LKSGNITGVCLGQLITNSNGSLTFRIRFHCVESPGNACSTGKKKACGSGAYKAPAKAFSRLHPPPTMTQEPGFIAPEVLILWSFAARMLLSAE